MNVLYVKYNGGKAGFGVEPNSTLAQCTQRVCSPRGARLPIPAACFLWRRLLYSPTHRCSQIDNPYVLQPGYRNYQFVSFAGSG